MEYSKFDSWIKKILATEDEEISCSECFKQVSDYVAWEVSGQPIQANLRKVKQHLDQCQACYDEYEILRDLVEMDVDRQSPPPGELPDSVA